MPKTFGEKSGVSVTNNIFHTAVSVQFNGLYDGRNLIKIQIELVVQLNPNK